MYSNAHALVSATPPSPPPSSLHMEKSPPWPVTEVDTTVFGKTNIAANGLGQTPGQGKNSVNMLSAAMDQSGAMLPQVSDGGSITGTFHIVTTDDAGPVQAMIDPTGTGAFASGVKANVVVDVPGNKGNIRSGGKVLRGPRSRSPRVQRQHGLPHKRRGAGGNHLPRDCRRPAERVLIKIANSNNAGPFGGVIAFQTAGSAAGNTTAADVAGTAAPATDGTADAAAGAGAAGADTTSTTRPRAPLLGASSHRKIFLHLDTTHSSSRS
ncbi:hypothetical protein P171DRAFT_521639 [Karstenula rhodostoma CBS 690.94]|uniref:Uncharacterized protein n=1 Tax=Karstenula rhodostoma CBS 690.94 TaxID=1392251 RepID=A0A9P4PHZ3_9PLEO|nr:hypothetical protein P171DRAFT_521639 [Karstenula rhodostoma CBS 690.94]